MAITSVSLLNSNGVDASLAKLREGSLQEFAAAQAQSSSSSITHISVSGKALISLDSLQASATAIKNSDVPPTVADFKILVSGVVGAINAVRQSVANASSSSGSLASTLRKRLESVDQVTSKGQDLVSALRKIGVERQGDGEFAVNQKRLAKALREDGKGAFSTLADFASKLTQAADAKKAEGDKEADGATKQDKSKVKSRVDLLANRASQLDSQPDSGAQSRVQAEPVAGFVAKSAVASYLTVASF